MTHSGNALYSPYGAYELKAKYQANFLTATLITFASVALILLAAWIHSLFAEEKLVVPPHEPIFAKPWELPQAPLIRHEPVVTSSTEAAKPPRVGIPKPVTEEEVIDETVVIASREELAVHINNRLPTGFAEGQQIIVDVDDEVYVPTPTEFVPMEIQPVMIHGHQPTYPRLARSAGITGVVAVRVLINEEGGVDSAIVEVSSHTTSLDEAAIEAALKNKFKPGIQNGRPVKCWVSYKVRFDLD